ncbi:MAG: hypothetical protein ABTR27_07185 [Candidatus Competibacter phosphatis]|uniref:DUF4105 domain-containing protein n=1 Tax=Candidatus Competibacter phosphatis TaxID=221280 RepID=A0ABX1TI89_9GAMM|nr:hypothetical protein [Candidatus Competibacter phosphatis]NMQ19103.1 hypothetical protein [Candidatus Competibacter phosphatis]
MAYHGEILDQCGLIEIDCSLIAVVAVSGDGPNVCGHLLLHTGPSRGGYYFHVAELRGYPRYMSESGYQRYLRESGKTELRRRYLSLPDPQGALLYLEELMAKQWTWLVLPNNCVAFVEEVIKAGGGTWSSYSNCPAVATQDTLKQRIQGFLGQLENEIYRLYGVPR